MAIINGQGRVAIRVAPTVYPTQFISTWKTDNAGVTAANQISIPTNVGYSYNCTVDWGDGTTSNHSGFGPSIIHTYSTAGTYTVKISGTFPVIRFAGGGDRLKILEITNWGNIQWKWFHMSFMDCSNLKITAQDTPDFSQVTSFNQCFVRTAMTSFSFKNTNLSSCTDFSYTFYQCPLTSVNFAGATLNTSSNISMYQMFYGASNLTTITGFNTLNTSKVTDMSYFAYNSKLGSIDMSGMNFSSCTSFLYAFGYTQLTNVNVTNMVLNSTNAVSFGGIFIDCKISTLTGFKTLNTGKVTNMNYAFTSSLKMTGSLDLSGMDFSSCTSFIQTFYGAQFSSLNISNWVLNQTSNVSFSQMLYGAVNMTALTGFNTLNTSRVTDMYFFATSSKLGSIDMSGMNFSSCTSFQSAFNYTQLTNVNVTNMILNTTNGVTLNSIFANTNISTLTGFKTLNTSKVTSMNQAFISSLKMSGSLDLSGMDFSSCTAFDYVFYGSVPSINVSNWVLNQSADLSMNYAFQASIGTAQGISTWNVSRVNGMYAFNAVISSTEYTNTLVNWSTLTLKPNIQFWVPGIKYNSSAAAARASIISNYGWTIIDGGQL